MNQLNLDTPKQHINQMATYTSVPNRVQISYAESEASYYQKIESELMKQMNIPSRSGLHKYAIRYLLASRQNTNLQLVWVMKTIQIAPIYFEMLKQMQKSKKASNPRQVAETIIGDEFKRLGF